MSRHSTTTDAVMVDLLEGFDDVDELDIDLLVDLLGLAGGATADRRRRRR